MLSIMVTKIRRGVRGHLYIEEWFRERGLNDEKVANRIGVARETVFRWRKEQHRLNPEKIAQLASALDLEPPELWRPPGSGPSLDAMIQGSPPDTQAMIADIVRRMAGKG
jgi:transcriptional regulator with XRE-family HTH domain